MEQSITAASEVANASSRNSSSPAPLMAMTSARSIFFISAIDRV